MNLNRILDWLAEIRLKAGDLAHALLMIWYRIVDTVEPRVMDVLDRVKPLMGAFRPHLTLTVSALILTAAVSVLVYSFVDFTAERSSGTQAVNEYQAQPAEADSGTGEDSNVIQRFTVLVLDAGHGGVDPGSIAKNGLTEKEVTLKLAKEVRKKLENVDNLHVALTRYDDRTININSRTQIIEDLGADFVLSLHLNSIPQEHIALVESYYKKIRRADPRNHEYFIKSSDDNVQESKALASAVQDSVFQTVKRHNEISVNAGLKTDSMRILSQNSAPGVLIEITCLSNPDEAERLLTQEYIDKLAQSIADGIVTFLAQREASVTAGL